jgi:DNA-binding beta-propeller fold protein YncE
MSLRSRVALFAALSIAAIAFATPTAASAFGPTLSFSSSGEAAGQLQGPGDAAVAPDGSLYVSDFSNRRIDVFSPDGAFLFAFGKEVAADGSNAGVCTLATGCKQGAGNASAGAVGAPEGVVIDSLGHIFIADVGGNRVDVFSLAGQFLFGFGKGVNALPTPADPDVCTFVTGCQEGVASGAAGALDEVRGIGLGSDGTVYVADRENNRIDAFSSQGTFLFAFGGGVNLDGSNICTTASGCKIGSAGTGAGEINGPADAKVGPGGQVLVADRRSSRIEVYTAAGVFQRAFGKAVNPNDGSDACSTACKDGAVAGTGAIRAFSIEIDAAGNVYAIDPTNNRLSMFSIGGQFQQAFGEGVLDGTEAFQVCLPTTTECLAGKKEGKAPGAVTGAFGVALDCRRGIYAVEHFNELSAEPPVAFARVERFADPNPLTCPPPVGEGPPPAGEKPSNRFSFGRLALNRRKGTATLLIKVPGPGTLVLKGRGIRTTRAAAKRAGAVRLTIRPSGPAKRRLLKAAKATVRARITFTPQGGTPLTKQRPLTLRAAPRR